MGKAKHYVILGFGCTGKSVLDFILKQYGTTIADLTITIYDQKYNPAENRQENYQGYIAQIKKELNLEHKQHIKIDFCANLDYCKNFINKIDLVITSPGINPAVFKAIFHDNLPNKVPIVSDIQLFIDNLNNSASKSKILAITGTNGKSTVCELTAYLLNNQANKNIKYKAMLGGNFGIPVLNLLNNGEDGVENKIDYVVELSSFQLALTDYLPCFAAVCLNITPDHLYWHGSLATYIADKLKIYNYSYFDIINFDQPLVFNYYKNTILPRKCAAGKEFRSIIYSTEQDLKTTAINFNADQDSDNGKPLWLLTIAQDYLCVNQTRILAISALPEVLKSAHNLRNLLAVIGILLGIISSSENLHQSAILPNLSEKLKMELNNYLLYIGAFKGLPYRCQLISEYNNIKVYNDSKATNLDACITAIRSVKKFSAGKIWLVLGGITKEDLDDATSRQQFRQSLDAQIGGVLIFGKDQKSKNKLLELLPQTMNTLVLNSLDGLSGVEEVVTKIYARAQPSDIILFSPAGASFDLFDNYMHRGELFSNAVLRYVELQTK